jgi:hypothetical protein
MHTVPHFQLVSLEAATLAGYAARAMTYTIVEGAIEMRLKQTFTAVGNITYYVCYAAPASRFQEGLSAADKMTQTFEIVPPST